MVGKVKVGADNPISVQSMTNTLTSDHKSTIDQINKISEAGAEIVRVSCPDENSTQSLKTIIKNVDVWLGNKPSVNLVIEKDVISILSFDQIKSIESKIEYDKPLSAPIKSGEKLGFLHINISGKKSLSIPLVAEKKINNINPFMKLFAAIEYLIFGTSFDEI